MFIKSLSLPFDRLDWPSDTRSTFLLVFFFQAEDGIRDVAVTGVQTCALPIFPGHGFEESLEQIDRDREEGRRVVLGGDLRHRLQVAQLDGGGLRADDVRGRSEERRVGKECRSRWSPYH